jgi:hypothetical protein
MFTDRAHSRREFLTGALKAVSACIALPSIGKIFAEEDPYDAITVASPVKSVIFVNMVGGMSHVDTLDPKPDSAFAAVNSSIAGARGLRDIAEERCAAFEPEFGAYAAL